MIRLLLADDEALLRKALAALLPLEGEITVLAEAEDGEAAVREATLRPPSPTCSSSTWRCPVWTASMPWRMGILAGRDRSR